MEWASSPVFHWDSDADAAGGWVDAIDPRIAFNIAAAVSSSGA